MAKKSKIPKTRNYLGLPIDSDGEIHFIMWMEELKQAGFIKSYQRGDTIILSNPVANKYEIQSKKLKKTKTENILMGHSYSWDFTIDWSEEGLKYFVNRFGEKWEKPFIINAKSMSFIESKPDFDYKNMSRLATLNIKWVWEKYGMFIQIVKNIQLFEETFTPKAYLITKTGKDRTVKHTIRTLEDYLETVNSKNEK